MARGYIQKEFLFVVNQVCANLIHNQPWEDVYPMEYMHSGCHKKYIS